MLVRKADNSKKKMHDEENLYENAETVVGGGLSPFVY